MSTHTERKAKGLCPRCAKVKTDKVCAVCSARAREKYQERRRLGLCVTCGEPTEEGRSKCPKHHNQMLAILKRRYDAAKAQSVCLVCTTPTSGSVMCEKCLHKHKMYRVKRTLNSVER